MNCNGCKPDGRNPLLGAYDCDTNEIFICVDAINAMPPGERCKAYLDTWLEEHLHAVQKGLGLFNCAESEDCESWFCAELVAAWVFECFEEPNENDRAACAVLKASASVSDACEQEIQMQFVLGGFGPDDFIGFVNSLGCFGAYGPVCGGCEDIRDIMIECSGGASEEASSGRWMEGLMRIR